MLNELTKEQQNKFPEYVKKWAAIGNSVVPEGFYTPDVVRTIEDAILSTYKAADKSISRDNILESTSPTLSPFIAAAHVMGKKGTPKNPVKSKLPHMESVELFLNQFTNPRDIIANSGKFLGQRYWGSLGAGFKAYVDFFQTETSLGVNELVSHATNIKATTDITCLTYDLLIGDNVCVFSHKPVFQTLDTSGDFPVARSGEIKWSDGTIIKY